MMKYIVNADDLGRNSSVNAAISQAFDKGVISSSTIMANTTTWEEVSQVVGNNPQASFGVHLNLTEGKPITDSEVLRKYKLVDENNRFLLDNIKLKNEQCLPEDLLEAIKKEWDAQINLVINIHKIPVTHFDGHHHIHSTFGLRRILLDLTRKYEIGIVRNMYCLPNIKHTLRDYLYDIFNMSYRLTGFPISRKSVVDKRVMSKIWHKEISANVLLTPYFSAYETACDFLKGGNKIADTIELMCHPGNPLFIKEMEFVNRFLFKELQNDAEMVNYKEIYKQ